MSIKIFEVPFSANDVDVFVQHVRLVGNVCYRNESTSTFQIFSRNDYADNFPVAEILALEIQQAVEDLNEANPNGFAVTAAPVVEAPVPEKRPGSLADILAVRGPIPDLSKAPQEETPGVHPLADMSDETMENASEKAMDDEPQTDDGSEEPTDMDTEEAEETAYNEGMGGELDASEFSTESVPEFPDAVDDAVAISEAEDQYAGLRSVAQSLSNARKDVFFREIGKLLQIDMTSDTEIMHVLAESGDLKRLLSTLFARMGIQISMTAVDASLRIQSQTLTFRADSVENVEHYRRGGSALLTKVESMLEEQARMEDLRTQIKTLEKSLANQQSQMSRQIATLTEDVTTAHRKLVPVTVFAARFNLYYVSNGQNHFLTVSKGASTANKPGEPVVYPLKSMNASLKQSEAHRFLDVDSAKAQRERVRKWPQNFTPFEGLSSRPEIHIARLGVDRVTED